MQSSDLSLLTYFLDSLRGSGLEDLDKLRKILVEEGTSPELERALDTITKVLKAELEPGQKIDTKQLAHATHKVDLSHFHDEPELVALDALRRAARAGS